MLNQKTAAVSSTNGRGPINKSMTKTTSNNPPTIALPKTLGMGRGKNLSMLMTRHNSADESDSNSEKSLVNSNLSALKSDRNSEKMLVNSNLSALKSSVAPVTAAAAASAPPPPPPVESTKKPIQSSAFIPQKPLLPSAKKFRPKKSIAAAPPPPIVETKLQSKCDETIELPTVVVAEFKAEEADEKKPIVLVGTKENDNQLLKKKRLNLDEYLKRRKERKDNLCDVTNGNSVNYAEQKTAAAIKNESDVTTEEDVTKPMTLEALNLVEIVVVSMATNTELSIPPHSTSDGGDAKNDLSQIIKANYMFDINDTIIKANGENVKLSNNSLIASIQDVLLKKCLPAVTSAAVVPAAATKEQTFVAGGEHGEDKTIMHLRKDRIRPATQSIAVQTECLLQFPMLRKSIDSGHSSMRDTSMTKYSGDSSGGRDRSSDTDYPGHHQRHHHKLYNKRSYSTSTDESDSSFQSSPHKNRRYDSRSRSPCSYKKSTSNHHYGYERNRRAGSRQNSLCRSDSDSMHSSDHSRLAVAAGGFTPVMVATSTYSDSHSKYSTRVDRHHQNTNHQRKNIGKCDLLLVFLISSFVFIAH